MLAETGTGLGELRMPPSRGLGRGVRGCEPSSGEWDPQSSAWRPSWGGQGAPLGWDWGAVWSWGPAFPPGSRAAWQKAAEMETRAQGRDRWWFFLLVTGTSGCPGLCGSSLSTARVVT